MPSSPEFIHDVSIALMGLVPDARVRVREDLVGKPLEIAHKGLSNLIEDNSWKSVVWCLNDFHHGRGVL